MHRAVAPPSKTRVGSKWAEAPPDNGGGRLEDEEEVDGLGGGGVQVGGLLKGRQAPSSSDYRRFLLVGLRFCAHLSGRHSKHLRRKAFSTLPSLIKVFI